MFRILPCCARHLARCALPLISFLIVSPLLDAQTDQMNALAGSVARVVLNSKQKIVVVSDFEGPGEWVTPLGMSLADEFTDDLSKSASAFTVKPRDLVTSAVVQNGLARSALKYPDIALAIASQLGAKIIVLGQLDRDLDQGIGVTVDCYRLNSGKDIGRFRVLIPMSDSPQALLHGGADEKRFAQVRHSPEPGTTPPVCLDCPNAAFTKAAAENKTSGVVLLSVVIGPDGSASEIYPVKALADGLTWSAAHTVHSWKFKPAMTADGEPVKVQQMIEVVFHIYQRP